MDGVLQLFIRPRMLLAVESSVLGHCCGKDREYVSSFIC